MDPSPQLNVLFLYLLNCVYVKKKIEIKQVFLDINWQAKVHLSFLIQDQQCTPVGFRI